MSRPQKVEHLRLVIFGSSRSFWEKGDNSNQILTMNCLTDGRFVRRGEGNDGFGGGAVQGQKRALLPRIT
jgi:hypothetical protein